jgi:hypothetical protein
MDKQAKQREKEDIRETKRRQKEVIKDLKRKEKEADALDVEKQVEKIALQEKLKEVKDQARERLKIYKAIEQKNQKASEPPDERPPQLNPAREMKPLPINYIPYKRIQEVRSGENSRAYLGSNAMSLRKPLAPNVLDVAAMEREKELAAQRRKAGHKWVQVMIR